MIGEHCSELISATNVKNAHPSAAFPSLSASAAFSASLIALQLGCASGAVGNVVMQYLLQALIGVVYFAVLVLGLKGEKTFVYTRLGFGRATNGESRPLSSIRSEN